MKRENDPSYVRSQYATETGLEARRAAYDTAAGPDARDAGPRCRGGRGA